MIKRANEQFLGQEYLIASNVDWSGAAEFTFEVHFNSGAMGTLWQWATQKNVDGIQTELVSSTTQKEFVSELISVSQATYRGRAFIRNKVSYDATLTTEPIQTHPAFASIAGTTEVPNLTEARWIMQDNRNVFIGFREDSEFAGIDSYLKAQWTTKIEWMAQGTQQAFYPGKVYSTVEDSYLLGGKHLCTGLSQEPFGAANRISAQLLNAPNWNPLIYK